MHLKPFQKQLTVSALLIVICVIAVVLFNACSSKITWNRYIQYVRELLHESIDLYNMSRQDNDSVIALIHAVDAETCARVCQQMLSSSEIEHEIGVKINNLLSALKLHRHRCLDIVRNVC